MHEGFYPFRDKKVARKEKEEAPGSFTVSDEELLVPGELEKFHLTEKEIIEKHFGKGEKEAEKGEEKKGDAGDGDDNTCARIQRRRNGRGESR